jgi:hypothetical protein
MDMKIVDLNGHELNDEYGMELWIRVAVQMYTGCYVRLMEIEAPAGSEKCY